MSDNTDFPQTLGRIEELVQQIERSADPAAQSAAREMMRLVLDMHGAGLARVLELLSEAGEDGEAILRRWTADDLVRSLLLLHGLHPEDLESRVEQALAGVRPYLQSHGGDVELRGIIDGTVRLRMQGSCHGCPSSQATLQSAIETAIQEAAPDIVSIEVEGLAEPPPPSGFVPLEFSVAR